MPTTGARNVLAAVSLVALAACAEDPFISQNVSLDGFSAAEIFQRGELELVEQNPDNAAFFFGEVERLYPFSDYARRALIMQAFAYHRDKDYENSRASAQRYIDLYPTDDDAAYAQYLLALSYYDQIDDVGRDQGLTFQALQSLRTVIEIYPDSSYARSAILKFDLAFDHLAGKEMEIGRYYLSRKHYAAAINRFRVVVEDFQTTTQTPEALYRLIEAYLALGLTDEAQTAAAVLGYNYQGSEWYAEAFSLIAGSGLRPEAEGDSWLTQIYRQTVAGEWL